ncbi:pantetheine-phosphate adenylyltransferase [Actinomyces vulturis]|uniref:pantetheine-phosphate adenylyltransferase n=1 Tax=Actinomyces vulturis TaxID=1857645 RepID=UPI0008364AAB|nr:pantetheine-phosphate adenylyltransferase [Actinomyces vulturis]
MSMAVYPGSFDPITMGHMDVIERASSVVDELIVVIAHNPDKAGRHLFTLEQREQMLRACTADLNNVRIEVVDGLIAPWSVHRGANVLIKGIRGGIDAESESTMAALNRELAGIDTMFLPSRPSLTHVSSSAVREILSWGGEVNAYVPQPALALISQFLVRENS